MPAGVVEFGTLRRIEPVVSGAAGLRAILVAEPEPFVRTFTEKLLTYALGRGIEPTDQPAIRAISAAAARDHYSLASIVRGVVASVPFQMRKGPS